MIAKQDHNRKKLQKVQRLTRSRFLSGVLAIGSGTALAQLVPILSTPIITRLYTAEHLGILGLYTTFISFSSGFISLGFSQAIVSASDDDEALGLFWLTAFLVAPASVLASGLLWLLLANGWLGFDALPAYAIGAMVLSLMLTGIYFALRYWCVRHEHYGDISRATVAQSGGRITTQIIVGVVQASVGGLILGEIVGRSLGLSRMFRRAGASLLEYLRGIRRERLVEMAVTYRKFPIFTMPASLLDSLSPALHIPIITAIFGVSAAGQYSIANMILILPLTLVGASVADVFHSRIAQYKRENPTRTVRFFYTVAGGLLAIAVVPAIILMVFGERLVPIILGADWQLSGAMIAVMAPRIITLLIVNPLSRVVLVYQGQEIKLLYNVLTVCSVVGTYSMANWLDWSLIDTIQRYTFVQISLHVVYFLILRRIVIRSQPASG